MSLGSGMAPNHQARRDLINLGVDRVLREIDLPTRTARRLINSPHDLKAIRPDVVWRAHARLKCADGQALAFFGAYAREVDAVRAARMIEGLTVDAQGTLGFLTAQSLPLTNLTLVFQGSDCEYCDYGVQAIAEIQRRLESGLLFLLEDIRAIPQSCSHIQRGARVLGSKGAGC